MRRLSFLCLSVLLLTLGAMRAYAAPPTPIADGPVRVTTYVLVRASGDPAQWAGGARVEHLFHDWYRLYPLAGETVDTTLSATADAPGVEAVSYDYMIHVDAPRQLPAALVPGDPLYVRQWHMPQVQAEAAWDAIDGEGAIIAILDTGVRTGGPDGLCQPLVAEYNTMTNSTAPQAARDNVGHGTHVAGTAAGCTGNGVGVTGLAYGARVMAVKVLGDNGSGSFSDVAEGIVWASDHGAGVINMSLGSACTTTWPACSTTIVNDAIDYAATSDVVVVASAGNDNRTFVGQPGNHPEAIAVSAMDFARNRAPYSNRGVAVDLGAPGGNTGADLSGDGFVDGVLQETFNSNGVWGYYYYQGTSMAAPHVTGAVGLLRSCVPQATRADVRAALESTADDLGTAGFDTTYGNGFLQIRDAMDALATQYGQDAANGCAFVGAPPCLTVTTTAIGPGDVSISPPSNCMAGSEPGYLFDTDLTVTATPDPDNVFTGWSGDAAGTANPLVLTRYGNLAITATFADCNTVTTATNGPGTVGVQPAPNCGGAGYMDGTQVTLTATPNAGYVFDSWSGDASGSANPLALTVNSDVSVTANFVAAPQVAVSLLTNGSVPGVTYRDEDVLRYTGVWSMLFDGSAHAFPGDVDALAILPDGSLLLSPDVPVKNLPGIGKTAVDDSDIVRYDPATGQYSWYFDGSDVGLTTNGEDIDALALLPDGDLLISTLAAVSVTGVSAADEDVLRFHGGVGSNTTSGTWSLYIDGSDLSAALGDIDAIAISGSNVYLSAEAAVTLGGQNMAPGDVFLCAGLTPGSATSCGSISRFWQGTAVGLAASANVDALELIAP
ncbi:MAG: S8 family serine peptidase [Candidatus Promineofilum sp.]|mgnify:CR=1 FL=1|nr:S8 family serine peptidase [Promineifilum sp.]MCW5864621.1 S8 family serine peptidase [Anaerolineae bacterium]